MTAIPHPLLVLLVDDDENDVLLIRRAITRLSKDAQLFAVSDGEQAVAYLQGAGEYAERSRWPIPHVLLLDHWMPRVCGLDVLCWLRTYPPLERMPVVVLSGGLSPAQASLMNQLNAVCCQKQVGLTDTARALNEALRAALQKRDQPARPGTWAPLVYANRPKR